MGRSVTEPCTTWLPSCPLYRTTLSLVPTTGVTVNSEYIWKSHKLEHRVHFWQMLTQIIGSQIGAASASDTQSHCGRPWSPDWQVQMLHTKTCQMVEDDHPSNKCRANKQVRVHLIVSVKQRETDRHLKQLHAHIFLYQLGYRNVEMPHRST